MAPQHRRRRATAPYSLALVVAAIIAAAVALAAPAAAAASSSSSTAPAHGKGKKSKGNKNNAAACPADPYACGLATVADLSSAFTEIQALDNYDTQALIYFSATSIKGSSACATNIWIQVGPRGLDEWILSCAEESTPADVSVTAFCPPGLTLATQTLCSATVTGGASISLPLLETGSFQDRVACRVDTSGVPDGAEVVVDVHAMCTGLVTPNSAAAKAAADTAAKIQAAKDAVRTARAVVVAGSSSSSNNNKPSASG